MLYSELFGKTKRAEPKDEISKNAKLLVRAGFIDKLMAGSYTLLPLGLRVIKKIEDIIRVELNKIGAQEVLMPLLHPRSLWNETGRWETAKEIMYQLKKNEKEYGLSFTHEEIVLDLIRKHIFSYKDFPIKIYHFSTKFRNELRVKSGILREREFIMKDLYSAHLNEKDLEDYYWKVAESYQKIFKELDLNSKIVEAGGGVFTDNITHEFQVLCNRGEDTIFYCDKCDFAQNKEISKIKEGDNCPKCRDSIKTSNGIEVGNIFKFGTSYSKKMNVSIIDKDGKKQLVYLASYGIGVKRTMGTIVELNNDEKGIIWPRTVSPFDIHLIQINSSVSKIKKEADSIYETLNKMKFDVLYDNREDIQGGEKLKDCDLIGIPIRLVVSDKTNGKIEMKARNKNETTLLSKDELLNKLLK
jgi:prolyl-tRNA synthetase